MNLVPASRSHVVLRTAGDPAACALPARDRAAVARLLLERGLEVSCRHDAGVGGDEHADKSTEAIAASSRSASATMLKE